MKIKYYSNEELNEFKEIILKKLNRAEEELKELLIDFKGNQNATGDTQGGSMKLFENGDECAMKEDIGNRVNHLHKFVEQLKKALVRIETRTYGFCKVTGKLIPKERLRVVPHATMCIEAKMESKK